MFIDSVEFEVSSGKGGAGCSSFRREKFVPNGGPDGGDGGRGGSVYFVVDNNAHTLSKYQGRNKMGAKNGRPGEGRKRHGKDGESLTLPVPPGTQVVDALSKEVLLDLVEGDEKVLFLSGGKGGLGNWHFRSSTNQQPTYAQPGLEGEVRTVRLELKLIADVGLVGFPNVGKSTLISAISNARPEVANYEFTTLTPKLGVVDVGDYESFVMADIPGIIENASDGRGLGIEFLKHIERTKNLLFMVDLANYRETIEQFKTLKEELSKFSDELKTRAFAIALTKVDAMSTQEANKKILEFLEALELSPNESQKYKLSDEYIYYVSDEGREPLFVVPISSVSTINVRALTYMLYDIIKESEA